MSYTYYLGSYLVTHHIYQLNRARAGFMQVNKTRSNPNQIWQPKVFRGGTNFGSEKWSARTNHCLTGSQTSTRSTCRTKLPGMATLRSYPDLRTLVIRVRPHNNISISLYPCVALYEVRDQVCSHFSSDCGGLRRPVALIYSTLIGPSAYHSHCNTHTP